MLSWIRRRFLRCLAVLGLVGAAACGEDDGLVVPPGTEAGVRAFSASRPGLRERARRVDNHLLYYGLWDDEKVALARHHALVVVHPNGGNLTRDLVRSIQQGVDAADPADDVIVLGYLSAGEDLRTSSFTDDQIRADARFRGDGSGPRVDPRGPDADGRPLTGIDPLGAPSPAGVGYASYYLDDNDVDRNGVGDGRPDRNSEWGGCFVNAGDPAWFAVVRDMTLDGPDGVAGLREILTTTHGRGLGCDGVFLDTFDTAAPNAWTTPDSGNMSEFEWTAPGYRLFLERLRAAFPEAAVLQNRGLFFFDPRQTHYAVTTRGLVDLVLFESYRLDNSAVDNPHPYFYPDNRHNVMPKLMAEANRPDGFRVLSLGYAEGAPDRMSPLTLTGESTLGFDSLLEDIRVTQHEAGFRHYLTDRHIRIVNRFVRDHADLADAAPPVWSSTYNVNRAADGTALPPTPRVGLQAVEAAEEALVVRWDVALDLNGVRYALYYQTAPFDFAADPDLTNATRVELTPTAGKGYAEAGTGPSVYPYEARVTGLAGGTRHYLLLRAFDGSSSRHEETNRVVKTGTPLAGSPLSRWRASNDASAVTYRVHHQGSWTWARVYVDADRNAATGFAAHGVGAEYLLENGRFYRWVGPGWAWSRVAVAVGFTSAVGSTQWSIPLSALGATRETAVVFEVQRSGEPARATPPYRHAYSTTDPASPMLGWYAENDADRVYYHVDVQSSFAWKQVFIDEDRDYLTGYRIGGVGAGYMIENGRLYKHAGTGWSWTAVGSAGLAVSGPRHDWSLPRSLLGETAPAGEASDLVFRGHGGGLPVFTTPLYEHRFSR